MCGILGSFNIEKIDEALFNKQLAKILHRGPDDSGVWFNADVSLALGSKRLAIQDLSVNGHMPMVSEDKNYTIVFNGEIFNYPSLKIKLENKGFHFKSNSDTESIIYAYQLWGGNCLQELEGQFSFCIYDAKKQELFLARDRAGEKPLYYWQHSTGIEFASELKALMANPSLERKLNPNAFLEYLQTGYASGDKTFINGVKKLPAAHYLVYSLPKQEIKISRYWSVPDQNVHSNESVEDLTNQLDSLLSQAVKKQLLADVPLGVLLSGGLDSSLITAYAAEHYHGKLKTFHISFPGFKKYDESSYAKIIANHFDTEHIELSGNDFSFDMIDEIMNYYDEPLADSSMLPTYLVASLTKKYVTVALGGDGGDELFGGYTTYKDLLQTIERKKLLPQSIRNLIFGNAKYLPEGFKGRNFLLRLRGNDYESFFQAPYFDSNSIKKALNPKYLNRKSYSSDEMTTNIDFSKGDAIHYVTKHDFTHYLCDDILVKTDRASMSQSLEMRTPWLDKNLVEFAFSKVPTKYKVNQKSTKILPKMLAKRKLPSNLSLDRKQGFSIPIDSLLKDRWYKQFKDELNCLPTEIFNLTYVNQLLVNTNKGYTNSHKLFALLIFSKWFNKYQITI